MCPLWPLHIFLIYILILGPLWIVSCGVAATAAEHLPFTFNPESLSVQMDETKQVLVNGSQDACSLKWKLVSDSDQDNILYDDKSYLVDTGCRVNWTSMFNITGNFLGKTNVRLRAKLPDGSFTESNDLPVTIVRQKRVIDTVFTYSVAILVSIIYINFGCALDWGVLRETIRRPIGPAIGFVCQFLFMPLVSVKTWALEF